jgi:putative endonuclease
MKRGFVYILTNKNRTVLYIGVTSDLKGRVGEHKEGIGSIFTVRYKSCNY